MDEMPAHMGMVPDFEPDVDFGIAANSQPASEMNGPAVPEPSPSDNEQFPAEVEEDVHGLMFLGSLTHSFELLGHRFVLRTLRIGEELSCAQVVKEYEGTMAQGKAYAIAQIAAALVSVDGREIVGNLGPDDTASTIHKKFEYIRERWYWPVIELIYAEFSDLMIRQASAYEALEGKWRASRTSFTP